MADSHSLVQQAGALTKFIIKLQEPGELEKFKNAKEPERLRMLVTAGVTNEMAQRAMIAGDAPRIHIALTYDLAGAVHKIDTVIMEHLVNP